MDGYKRIDFESVLRARVALVTMSSETHSERH